METFYRMIIYTFLQPQKSSWLWIFFFLQALDLDSFVAGHNSLFFFLHSFAKAIPCLMYLNTHSCEALRSNPWSYRSEFALPPANCVWQYLCSYHTNKDLKKSVFLCLPVCLVCVFATRKATIHYDDKGAKKCIIIINLVWDRGWQPEPWDWQRCLSAK